jgi:hypothetical protein
MPTGTTCKFPEHHHGGGSGFPWGLLVIVAGAVIVCTSGAFAEIVHDVMVMVLATVGAVVAAGLGGLGLALHHQRAMRRAEAPRPILLTARLEQRPGVENATRPAVEAPHVVTDLRLRTRGAISERRP